MTTGGGDSPTGTRSRAARPSPSSSRRYRIGVRRLARAEVTSTVPFSVIVKTMSTCTAGIVDPARYFPIRPVARASDTPTVSSSSTGHAKGAGKCYQVVHQDATTGRRPCTPTHGRDVRSRRPTSSQSRFVTEQRSGTRIGQRSVLVALLVPAAIVGWIIGTLARELVEPTQPLAVCLDADRASRRPPPRAVITVPDRDASRARRARRSRPRPSSSSRAPATSGQRRSTSLVGWQIQWQTEADHIVIAVSGDQDLGDRRGRPRAGERRDVPARRAARSGSRSRPTGRGRSP